MSDFLICDKSLMKKNEPILSWIRERDKNPQQLIERLTWNIVPVYPFGTCSVPGSSGV